MKTEKNHIANRLRKYRKIKGYSQNEVVEKLGLKSITPIDNWEKGLSFPNLENLLKLSILYEVSERELYNQVFQEIRIEIDKRKKILASKKKKK